MVGICDGELWIVECWCCDDGYKLWVFCYGEYYMVIDGMCGGFWKVLGWVIQKLVGVGLSSLGGG